MLETCFTQKFHFSSETQVVEVGKPCISHDFQANPLCNLHISGKSSLFQLRSPVSPSWSGIFEWNKFLACLVMSQLARKPSLEEIGAVTKKWHAKSFIDPPLRIVLKLPSSYEATLKVWYKFDCKTFLVESTEVTRLSDYRTHLERKETSVVPTRKIQ